MQAATPTGFKMLFFGNSYLKNSRKLQSDERRWKYNDLSE